MKFSKLSSDRTVISLACTQANYLGKGCPFFKIPFQFTQLMTQSTSLIAKPAIIVRAGRHQTCLPSWLKESSKHVYARCFFRCFMGLKSQKFSRLLLARHLYTRKPACEPQSGSLAYLSVAFKNGTKNDQFSRSKVYI